MGEYDVIPDDTLEALEAYVETGRLPGDFLVAVLENNLQVAFGKADRRNLAALRQIVLFVYNRMPSDCWGSAAKITAWVEKGGMVGMEAAEIEASE